MICATQSTAASCSVSSVGNRVCSSRRASSALCAGISTIRSGWTTSPPAHISTTTTTCTKTGNSNRKTTTRNLNLLYCCPGEFTGQQYKGNHPKQAVLCMEKEGICQNRRILLCKCLL